MINRHRLVDAAAIGIIETAIRLDQFKLIGSVPVNFAGASETERSAGSEISSRDQQIQCPDRVYIEVVVWYLGSPVVGRLSSGVDHEVGALGLKHAANCVPVADIEFKVPVSFEGSIQPFEHASGRRRLPEERLP